MLPMILVLLLAVGVVAVLGLQARRRAARARQRASLARFVEHVQTSGTPGPTRATPPAPALTPAPGREPVALQPSDTLPTFADVGGMAEVKARLAETVGLILRHPAQASTYRLGFNGVLLYGPPGSGKTHLARCLAGEYGCSLLHLSSGDLVGGPDPAANVRAAFELAVDHRPVVLLFDEFDAIAHRREGHPGDERAAVAELCRALEESQEVDGVLVVAATSDLDGLDPAVVRPGRFDHHVRVDLPDADARRAIVEVQLARRPSTATLDLDTVVERTRGMSAAAVAAVVERAALAAFREAATTGETVQITEAHLLVAITASGGEDRPTVEDWSWDRLVLPEPVVHELRQVEAMLAEPALAESLGVTPPRGLLLAGPPGTGKTTIARVLAAQARCSFYPVSVADVTSKWAGESEQAIQRLFARARAHRPAIVFVDEVDALGARRGEAGNATADRQLAQLLVEVDGLTPAAGVLVIGATNRLDAVDPALRRGGRLARVLEIPLPDQQARWRILEQATRRMPTAGVDLSAVAAATGGRSGADLVAICQQAALEALVRARRDGDEHVHAVTAADFARAVASARGVAH